VIVANALVLELFTTVVYPLDEVPFADRLDCTSARAYPSSPSSRICSSHARVQAEPTPWAQNDGVSWLRDRGSCVLRLISRLCTPSPDAKQGGPLCLASLVCRAFLLYCCPSCILFISLAIVAVTGLAGICICFLLTPPILAGQRDIGTQVSAPGPCYCPAPAPSPLSIIQPRLSQYHSHFLLACCLWLRYSDRCLDCAEFISCLLGLLFRILLHAYGQPCRRARLIWTRR
jgi:hypothetical protein